MIAKSEGGLDLPNLGNYYEVVTITRILSWRYHVNQKVWVTMAGPNLAHALWAPVSLYIVSFRNLPPSLRPHFEHPTFHWNIGNSISTNIPPPTTGRFSVVPTRWILVFLCGIGKLWGLKSPQIPEGWQIMPTQGIQGDLWNILSRCLEIAATTLYHHSPEGNQSCRLPYRVWVPIA